MRFSVGQEFEGLEFVRVLQPSERSVAYIVRDVISQRMEYLKLVPESLQQNEKQLQRFMREARLHAGLAHPNIAQFYSVRRIDGELVITREWVEGESLASKLAAGPIPTPQAIDYLAQALLALEYAHGQGVVHRDFKPHKLLITESGIVKLTGFDLARRPNDPRLTGTGVIMGSVDYMSPEQVKGLGAAEERSDLYACGVVAFQSVTGKLPYARTSEFEVMVAHVEDPIPSAREVNETVTAELDAVIRRAMAKEPDDRYQSASEFRDALLEVANLQLEREVESMHRTVAPAPVIAAVPPPTPPAPPPIPKPVVEPELVEISPDVDLSQLGEAWNRGSGDLSRAVGIAIAGFSVCMLVILAGMILLKL